MTQYVTGYMDTNLFVVLWATDCVLSMFCGLCKNAELTCMYSTFFLIKNKHIATSFLKEGYGHKRLLNQLICLILSAWLV